MGQLAVNGYIQAGGDGCGCAGASGSPIAHLGLACGNGSFQSIVSTESPIQVRTPGSPGDSFVDIAVLGDFDAIEFLYAKSDSPMVLRVGAEAASLTGNPVSGSVIANGTDEFNCFFGIQAINWIPAAGTYTIAQVLAQINALCAGVGLPTPRISYADGRYTITDWYVGPVNPENGNGQVTITGGALNAQLGFANNSYFYGSGEDIEFQGLFMTEFRRHPYAPKRIQVSGSGSLTVIAAGRTSL